MRRLARAAGAIAVCLVVVGCGRADTEVVSAPISSPPSPPLEPETDLVLSVDFDEADGSLAEGAPVADDSGHHMTGKVRLGGAAPEALSAVTGKQGRAIRFASPCESDEPKDDSCPRGIIEFPAATLLNPGDRDFSFGASVLMTEAETSSGANLMQKGFNLGGGSQWKLQVDGDKGHPSCVLVGVDDEQSVTATAKSGISDGEWHDVECVKADGHLSILLDGVESNRKTMPESMIIEPSSALRVGGKNIKADNDQFFGAIDDIFLRIARD